MSWGVVRDVLGSRPRCPGESSAMSWSVVRDVLGIVRDVLVIVRDVLVIVHAWSCPGSLSAMSWESSAMSCKLGVFLLSLVRMATNRLLNFRSN